MIGAKIIQDKEIKKFEHTWSIGCVISKKNI